MIQSTEPGQVGSCQTWRALFGLPTYAGMR